MSQTELLNIEKQTAALTLDEHIRLMERLARQLAAKRRQSQVRYDWSELYGRGKGLWAGEDAQAYVNRVREDR